MISREVSQIDPAMNGEITGKNISFPILESLIKPLGAGDFFNEVEGVSYRHFPAVQNGDTDIFSWADLNRLLNESFRRLYHPALRLALNGQVIPPEDISHVVKISKRSSVLAFSKTKVMGKIAKGATLIITAVENYHDGINALQQSLSEELSERVQINAYFSPGDAPGFRNHYDTHDLFIVQTEGSKKWTIGGVSHPLPLESQSHLDYQPPIEEPVELILRKGDVLYLPRGMWHSAFASEGPSLHLAVGIHHATRIDFLEWLLERAKHDVDMRRNLKKIGDAEDACEEIRRLLVQFSNQLKNLSEEYAKDQQNTLIHNKHNFEFP